MKVDLKNKMIILSIATSRIIIGWMTTRMRNKLGALLGSLIFNIMKERQKIAIENIKNAFPTLTTIKVKKIAKESFKNLGITYIELFALDKISKNELTTFIDFDAGLKFIKKIYENNNKRGMIFLSGHFGNWELIAYSVRIFSELPITIVVKPQANKFIDAELNKIRTAHGNKIISMFNAARTIIKCINDNEIIALLVDQAATKDKDIFVNFFGRKASTYKVVAELALRYNIPIIMGFAVRKDNGKYYADIREVKFNDLKYNQDAIKELTQRHTTMLEKIIQENPTQWTWMHKRWKYLDVK